VKKEKLRNVFRRQQHFGLLTKFTAIEDLWKQQFFLISQSDREPHFYVIPGFLQAFTFFAEYVIIINHAAGR